MSFTRIFYDGYKNRLYCVENDGTKRKKLDFHPKFEYYVPDKTGTSEYKDIFGNPVSLMTSETRKDMKSMAEAVKTCETDIGEDIKFLQKRYGGKNIKPNMENFQIATLDIEVESKYEFPKQEEAKHPINLISVHYSQTNEIFTYGLLPYTGNSDLVKNYHYFANENDLIERFIKDFRKQKVDIISSWAGRTFDIPYIINRCENLGIDVSLSPINMYRQKHWGGYHINQSDGYDIAGIAQLDGLDLFKNFEREKRVSYSLQNIGMEVVGEGKKDYEGTINDAWEKDWNGFVEYNVQDVVLVTKIEEKKKYIELAITLCYQTLIPFQKIFSSISLVEGYILRFLYQQNLVMPDKSSNKLVKRIPGAYVYAKSGIFKYCMSLDAESLYPFTILQNGISIETLIMDGLYDLKFNGKQIRVTGNDELTVKRNNQIVKILVKDLNIDDEIQ